MQLQAANPFFPAPVWNRPQISAAAPESVESVELSNASVTPPNADQLSHAGKTTALQAAAPVLGMFARATGGSCPYLQSVPKVGSFEFARTVATNLTSPHEVLTELHARHGDHFQVRLPGKRPMLFDSRPDSIHQVLVGTRGKQGVGVWEKTDELAHGFRPLFGEKNVFSGKWEAWRTSREILEPALRFGNIHNDATIQHLGGVIDKHLATVAEGEVDLRHLTQRVAMDSAFQTLFGSSLSNSEIDETLHAFSAVRRYIVAETLNPTPIRARELQVAHRTLNRRADRMIEERRTSGVVRNDALGALLGANLEPERLRHEVLTLMLAGHETTASFMSWALLELAHDPKRQESVHASLASLGGGLPDETRWQDQTHEVKSLMQKTIRERSPAYVLARVAEQDTQVGETLVPAGTMVVMSPLESHKTGPNSKNFGFGGGTRLCLGQSLARLETNLFLTRFVQKFAVEPISDFSAASDVSHHPKEARVRVRVREKESAE